MKKTLGALAISAMAVLAACGVEPSTGSPTPTSTPEAGLEVIVPPDSSGGFPGDLVVACPTGPAFPISALDGIRPLAEADPGGVAEALEPFLSSEEGVFWPQEGWQILHMTDESVQLVTKTDDGFLAFMQVSDEASGWTWSGSSMTGEPCLLRFTVPENLNTVDWRLDPSAVDLTPTSTEVAVILTERECVSGMEIGDRLLGPQIVITETQVFIAFAAERPPGEAFDCQGNPDIPFVVSLPEAIGDRELVEGLDIGITLDDYVG